jgi:MFS family permease
VASCSGSPLSALFALDSLGGGFLTQALIAFFFARRFGVGVGTIGLLFFGASIANAASQFGAAYLARRIGLIDTMVFTHIPANLSLVAVAFAPNFTVAAALYLLRELMIQMDVPTRQSYVMAVVRPEERTFVRCNPPRSIGRVGDSPRLRRVDHARGFASVVSSK